jgi:type 1 glutamine amidotransferase
MGKFHPLAWYQEYDGGRAFYTALGHLSASYGEASFMHHVYGGIYWAATGNGFTTQ